MTEPLCDILIIGAGPGGYVAALRAAQLGARVVLVEKDQVGGTCLNWGCVPTKALYHTAELLDGTRELEPCGISTGPLTFDLAKAMAHKDRIVQETVNGVKNLLKRRGVQVLYGQAAFTSPTEVAVTGTDGTVQSWSARRVVVATGSQSAKPPIPGLEGPGILTSTEALALTEVPKRLLVIGAGVIGLEFACIFAHFGSQVTVVEMLPRVLPTEDEEISKLLAWSLDQIGIKIWVAHTVQQVRRGDAGELIARIGAEGKPALEISADAILVAVGRKPYTEGLNLQAAGLRPESTGAVAVDGRYQTAVPGIYAVGDVTGRYYLAHVASMEGETAVENALGANKQVDYRAVPRCTYTFPPVASVGLTETEARQAGYSVIIGRFPWSASAKARIEGAVNGLAKIVADAHSHEILGVHIVGEGADTLISEGVLAIALECTLEELENLIHAHPTLSENIREAALVGLGRPLHTLGS